MKTSKLTIDVIESQPFAENTYIVRRNDDPRCLIVDPGLEPDKILRWIDRHQLQPASILNTHGHSDHIAGNGAMKAAWPSIPLIIGELDEAKLADPEKNLSAPFGLRLISPPADQTVREGAVLSFAGIDLEVRETPGHSVGHVIFVFQDDPTLVFGGDVLFRGGIGRTDFPDGNHRDLLDSIATKLFTLPDSTVVFPGHGPPTTIGEERRSNPFLT